jgi:hypothetical protein
MTNIDNDDITDDEILTSVCVGLVAIDEERNIISLVHKLHTLKHQYVIFSVDYTVQEYFKYKGDLNYLAW